VLAGCGADHATSGSAGTGERIALTRGGVMTARDVVLRRSDLLSRRWSGGLISPQPTARIHPPCAGYPGAFDPDESDIVTTGVAETVFTIPQVAEVDTFAEIEQTPTMAEEASRRWAQPAFARCLRQSSATPAARIRISRIPFPAVGSFAAHWRVVIGDNFAATRDDWLLISSGCARFVVIITTDSRERPAPFERALASFLARRAASTCSMTA
jgi:hypothetical protein